MSEQQHNQDLKRMYKREYQFFYQNALHLTRVQCATFYHGALRHEQHEDDSYCLDPLSRYPVISPPRSFATNQLATKKPSGHQPTRRQVK